jgi:hypothetical protein
MSCPLPPIWRQHIRHLLLRVIDVTSLNRFLHQMHHAETGLGLVAVLHRFANAQNSAICFLTKLNATSLRT